jgi:hypothetical protein
MVKGNGTGVWALGPRAHHGAPTDRPQSKCTRVNVVRCSLFCSCCFVLGCCGANKATADRVACPRALSLIACVVLQCVGQHRWGASCSPYGTYAVGLGKYE